MFQHHMVMDSEKKIHESLHEEALVSDEGQGRLSLCARAADFAKLAHEGQYRKVSRAPYYTHVERVAELVSSYQGDEELIAAAYLHDTIEDTATDYEQLKAVFGRNVANMVYQLTNNPGVKKFKKVAYLSSKMRGMNPDVLLIKLCDILDNVSDNPSADQLDRYEQVVLNVENHLLAEKIKFSADNHYDLIRRVKGIIDGEKS